MASASREASLILRLIDRVTAPAKAITGALTGLNATMAAVRGVNAMSTAIGNAGRNMRRAANDAAGLSVPVGFIAADAAKQVFEFEKVGNAIEAVTGMTEAQREELESLAQTLNTLFPATNTEIMQAALELAKAGMDFEQIRGSLKNTLNLALAGDFGIKDSAEILIGTAVGMRLAMDSELEAAEATARVADMIAFGANRSLAEIPDFGITLRYVASAAAATGMTLDELGAAVAVLANNNIKGSSAGTGLRYALLQLLNPSKAASAALARLNIDMADYVTGAERVRAGDVVTNLGFDGIHIEEMGLESQIQAILDDPSFSKSPAKLVSEISKLITEAVGDEGFVDAEVLAQSLSDTLTVLGTKIDLMGLFDAFRANPLSESLFATIFGKYHAVKMMALLAGDLNGMVEDFRENSRGAADEMSSKRLKGIVGDWYELTASIENFYIRLSETGLLSDAAKAITSMSEAIGKFAETNPVLLRFGTYAALALAALAPLGFIISGVAAAVSFLINPLTLVAGVLGTLAYLNFDGLVAFWDAMSGAFTAGLTPESQAMLQGILDWLGKLPEAFAKIGAGFDFAGWGQAVGQALAAVANNAPGFIQAFQDFQTRVQPVVETIWGPIRAFARSLLEISLAVGRLAHGAWDGLWSFFQSFGDNLDPATVEILGNWGRAIADAATAIFDLVAAAAQSVDFTWLKDALGVLGGLTADGLDAIVQTLEKLGNLPQALSFSVDIVMGMVPGIIQWINDVAGGVVSFAVSIQWPSPPAWFNDLMWLASGGSINLNSQPGQVSPEGKALLDAVPTRASGGPLWKGMFLAGEKGPELGFASGGGHMFNADETKAILSGRAGGGLGPVTINVNGARDPHAVADEVGKVLDTLLQRSRTLSMEDRLAYG